jgi:L-fuculose-phosphate aldolase
MLLPDAREAIVTTGQELSRAGLVVGTAGNVSVRDGDLAAVSPSGLRYAELIPDTASGRPVSRDRRVPAPRRQG